MLEIYLLQANIGGNAIYRIVKIYLIEWRILSTHPLTLNICYFIIIYGEYNFTRLSRVVCTLNCDYFHSSPPESAGPSPAVCTVPRASILLFKIWEIERSESGENKVDIRYKVEILSDQSKKEVQDINTKYIYKRWTATHKSKISRVKTFIIWYSWS